MQIVGEKCEASLPNLLVGPHHGAPTDRKQKNFRQHVEKFTPERVFVSVGTFNQHNDVPSPRYINLQAARGCRVICTQLTRFCDNRRQKPVLQTALLLGLRAPNSGISCRGCFRLNISGDSILGDAWDEEHLKKVRTLKRPQCIPDN